MKYNEYQVWFHAFNNAVLGVSQGKEMVAESVIAFSNQVANYALKKFQEVEEAPPGDLKPTDFKDLLTKITEEVAKKHV